MLPEADINYLRERWPAHRVEAEGNQVLVVLPDYALPQGFSPQRVDLLVVLPFGFPETQPDMFWVDPEVTVYGQPPATAELRQTFLGRTWQRFSRHLPAGTWRPGDNLQSWIAQIGTMLAREAAASRPKAA